MILPIYAYGNPVLKKIGKEIEKSYEGLDSLLKNMWDTMYNAKGIGLAAPQIGRDIRLFIIDTKQLEEDEKGLKGCKMVFINAEMLDEFDEVKSYEEGCLSIPNVRGDIDRKSSIKIKYLDEQFKEHIETFSGLNARVIQHEYDHIDGKLFTEKLKPIRKRRVQRKLDNIRKGDIKISYRMKFV